MIIIINEQYAELQDLYTKYGSKGFTVLGFPCNQVCVRVCVCVRLALARLCAQCRGVARKRPPHTLVHRRPRSKPFPLAPPSIT